MQLNYLQVVRKAWFGDLNHVRESVKIFSKQLFTDLEQYLYHLQTSICGQGKMHSGKPENWIQKLAGLNVADALAEMLTLVSKMNHEATKSFSGTAGHLPFNDTRISNALNLIRKDKLLSEIFHVLLTVCPVKMLGACDVDILYGLGFKDAIDEMVEARIEANAGKKVENRKKTVVSKGESVLNALRGVIPFCGK